jgi:hypothetical protein
MAAVKRLTGPTTLVRYEPLWTQNARDALAVLTVAKHEGLVHKGDGSCDSAIPA